MKLYTYNSSASMSSMSSPITKHGKNAPVSSPPKKTKISIHHSINGLQNHLPLVIMSTV